MSSGAVLAQIGACESQIVSLKAEIAKLQSKIEEQACAIRVFAPRMGELQGETQDKATKCTCVSNHQAKAVVSFRFRDTVQEKFNGEKANMEDVASRIEEGMGKERALQLERLLEKDAQLTHLKTQLNSLQAEYQAALAREEAERQAQANANAQKNSGKK